MKPIITVFSGILLTSATALAATPKSLTVGEGFVNPIGFHEAIPVFSWKLPEGTKRQTAYHLEAKVGNNTWDSGWVGSDQSTFVPYGGPTLASRQQGEWRINFRDENNKESGWSDPARFELGLLSNNDWHAQWIRPSQTSDPNKEPVALLRRNFTLDKKVTRARVYVTARGLFELHLNGKRISNDHFANGFTSYDKRLDTLTYDITTQLQSGDNQLQATLGSGWYAGRFPFGARNAGPYGKNPELLLQLEITFDDNSQTTILSDNQWQGTFSGPIVSSSIYDGETFDARKTPADWQPVAANPALGNARLTPKSAPPVREAAPLAAQAISQPQPGHFIFDLGQNMVGWARVKLPMDKDQTLTIHYAEMLKQDGTLYTENYRTAKSTDTYTAATAGINEFAPHFTFHGFRYVELTGLPASTTPQKEWVTGIVVHSDLPTIGTFTSSHEKLNKLQSNILWSWRDNTIDIPTDCPQRDERLGWTGDAEVFCATSMFNTDAHAFWKSWLGSMRDDQDADGSIPDYIPTAKQNSRNHSPGWMDAATVIPWEVYVRTGDLRVLQENYGMMEKLVAWYRGQSKGGLLPTIKGYGDWLQPYPQTKASGWMGDRPGDTPFPLLGVAFYARSTQILAASARLLGRTDDAKRYSDEATSIRAAFIKEYFDTEGKLKTPIETQTAYVLPIAFDIMPPELKPKAADNLARLLNAAGGNLRTGFLGTPFLAPALDQTGHPDLAAKLLFNETYPSWFYPINQGATTMWERWNSFTLDKGFGDVSMNSFNHYSYGAIGQWMYERIAGLAPDPAQPGYKHFFIRPLIVSQLNSARAELETPYGKASTAWTRQNGKASIDVIVPPNTTATIEFPDHRKPELLQPGAHHFESAVVP